ncbi:MAG: murein biosynthesis integral membrane protein MurJ [Pseudomonadota bacterium]
MKPGRGMFGAFLTVGGWTMISRILGLIRDLFLAAFLGAGAVAEAFQAAFALPNLFRRFFAEGAFNLAFVPIYSKKLQAGEDDTAFASNALSALAGILIIFTLIAQLIMPALIYMMASGFVGDGRFDLSVDLARIIFPYVLFISLAAVMSGILNARGHFALAAAAPVALNIVLIAAMSLAYLKSWDIGFALSWAVLIAGIVQFGLVYWGILRLGMKITWAMPVMNADMKRLLKIILPAVLTGGVIQINLLIGRQVASYFEGAYAWLYYADRLYQLPLGVVGIAIGIVLLPNLSRALAAADDGAGRNAFNRSLEFGLILTIPCAVALVMIPLPLISILFERGAFSFSDSQATAAALAIYGVGLPAFVGQKIIQPLYFAREDTQTPFRYALFAMIINAALAIGLSFYIGYLAAAVGTTLSAWAMLGLLWYNSRDLGEAAQFDAQLLYRAPRIIVASILMGLVILGFYWLAKDFFFTGGLRYIALAILMALGAAVYGACLLALKTITLAEIKGFTRRRTP